MHSDMASPNSHNPLILPKERRDHSGICLGSPDKEKDIGSRNPEGLLNFGLRALAIMVQAVSRGLFQICLNQTPDDHLMRTLGVIALK